ncbi:4'-phosphopantetheinyl transferase [Thioploca ingrica]|uniref:4'-phosphopantetheinyl transferase n=1 Tax=Thioploca ingrica TaxID=40754 RepID=A0A090AI31_9GAMM|nr:4'-phosphopantetheinyl transferase [Thioploca ingrica]
MVVTDNLLIVYTHFNKPLLTDRRQDYAVQLPMVLQQKMNRFRRWQDQQAFLFGKLLLQQALYFMGYPADSLYQLQYNEYNRPFLEQPVDFNISHAGDYVICAITTRGRVGIDIELIKPINLEDFQHYLTPQEWQAIISSPVSYEVFYNYWTIKESVIKADGRGLSIPLRDIHFEAGMVRLDKHNWFIHPITVDPRYPCHCATNCAETHVQIKKISFVD